MENYEDSLKIVLGYVRDGNVRMAEDAIRGLECLAILEGRDVSEEVDGALFYVNFHAMINRLNDAYWKSEWKNKGYAGFEMRLASDYAKKIGVDIFPQLYCVSKK